MKKVILDENLPNDLRLYLGEFEVVTVQFQGWSGIQNGELIKLVDAQFHVFVTGDKNLQYQQNLKERKVAIVVVPFTRLDSLLAIIVKIRESIIRSTVGGYEEI